MLNKHEESELLNHLIIARNKVFAHTDLTFLESPAKLEIDYSRLEQLQETGFQILEDLYEKIFKINIDSYNPNGAVLSVVKMVNKEIKG